MRLVLKDWNLNDAERLMCVEALATAGSIVEAAKLLDITKHALKRRIIKHRIEWPRSLSSPVSDFEVATVEEIEWAHFEPINISIEPIVVNLESNEPFVVVETVEATIDVEPKLEPAELELERVETAELRTVTQPDMARVSRAFSWLAALTPKRIWDEDVGDAIETIYAMERAGCSRFMIRLKITSAWFWVLIAVIRELLAALTGRKSPHGGG